MSDKNFESEYKKLNKAQKEAVDTIDGPTMVVAGPGTGKTQILSLRVANILTQTDIKPDGILCLTFTNAAVDAMKERLSRYIGKEAEKVNIFTFHSFGMKIIEQYFEVLGLKSPPKLLEDTEIAVLFDQILKDNEWEYLRPRADSTRYFKDLRSLISLLRRERITKEEFSREVEKEIKFKESDESSFSTRGESKGQIKKEVEKEIEGLERSREVVRFINLYEEAKKEKKGIALLDYDDVLEYMVDIVEKSSDALSSIRENYLYVLVDEHQDSSLAQNEFLARVWGKVERPNIMVVGDDRQLIYGFSGASIEHFRGFQKTFKDAILIPLVNNYRSTQVILDASHALLQSVMSSDKLVSQSKEHNPIQLVEANTEIEEIIAAGEALKEKIKEGIDPSDCAILVPKNIQVRRALDILHNLGLEVSSLDALHLFDQEEAMAFLRVLKIIDNGDVPSLALSFLDSSSLVTPPEAHNFLASQNMREFTFQKFIEQVPSLFSDNVEKWASKLVKWKDDSNNRDLESLLKIISLELFENGQKNGLISPEDIGNTILSLLLPQLENNPDLTLAEFINYLDRLNSYGEHVPIISKPKEGVKVLTMHSSKGLEFDWVWIAHMSERSLAGGKKIAFNLPESILERIEERDVYAIKRKLYVAITRAKRFCTLSYALESKKGTNQELAKIVANLPTEVFKREKVKTSKIKEQKNTDLSPILKLVIEKYTDRYVSASLLNNFFECPWKWYFRSFLKMPEEKSESLEFGDRVHKAIDQILKMKKILTKQELNQITNEDKDVLKVIAKWTENRLPEILPDRQNEQPISIHDDRFPNLKIYGKLDLIEKLDSGHVRVTDFKTGSVKKKSEIEKLDDEERMSNLMRQLAMYSYLLQESQKWKTNVSESRLEFLEAKNEKDVFYNTKIEPEQVKMLIKDITDYEEMLKSGKWVLRECHYNSYGKNTVCEYCKMAGIYK